jgi:hypothetical protein
VSAVNQIAIIYFHVNPYNFTQYLMQHWACSAGYKPTLLQLFGLLQLQSIERKIL